MSRIKLKGINKVRKRLASGQVRTFYYHRATKSRLQGEPGSPEFLESYIEAEKQVKSLGRNRGTLKELIQQYVQSDDFSGLADRTKSDYRKQITKIENTFGDMPIEVLNDSRVRADFLKWRDKLAKDSARQADYALTVLGILLSWSLDRGLVGYNHAQKPKKKYRSNRSEKIWLDADVRAFLVKAGPELQLALILARDTGQRQGDLLRLTWASYDGAYIRLTQSKTGRRVEIPVTQRLKAALTKARANRTEVEATTILTRPDGQPWKVDHFRHAWRAVTQAAGLDGLRFNDLRGTAVTELADAGCTSIEIAAITGHSLKSVDGILEHYLARTTAQGNSAIVKLENARRTKTANRAANRSGKGK